MRESGRLCLYFKNRILSYIKVPGAVAERLKAMVLKTIVPKGTGGSNPSCSVLIFLMTNAPLRRRIGLFTSHEGTTPIYFPGKYLTNRLKLDNVSLFDVQKVGFDASFERILCEIRKDLDGREK